ncbi:MAG: T9SS type A sorting domain-containing protein [Sphingomonadales bacterium]|nr:T9SS type A sorting domain-containing protein [Sphingomonadales bacterium]
MKKISCIFILLLSLTTLLNAQNLPTEFNIISTNNDMMGGALVVFCQDGIIENISIGKSDFARNINSSVETKYRIASISKTITAIAVMQLVEQNLLDLDADISSILGYSVQNPNYPTSPITTRMLLSHTSTIIDGSTYSNFLSATVNNNPIPNLSEILTPTGSFYTSAQFNNTIPGTYFNYSNINYVILGTIVEKVSNLRFDVYCKQNISVPLGIDASFNVNDLTDIDQLAVLYRKINGVWTPQADNYQGTQPVFSNLNGYIPGTNGGRFGPQGGFRCSGQDLAKIFLVLMNKGNFNGDTLLLPSSCNAMFSNEWTFNGSNGNNYYGLFRSWGLGIHRITSTPGNDLALTGSTSMLGHTGEAYGLVSDAYFDTIRKVGFVFMNNGVGINYQSNSNSVFYTIEQQVFAAIENHGDISSCQSNVGVNPIQKGFNMIYPNPTNGLVNVEIQNRTIQNIKLYDLQGRLIKEISESQFDLSNCLNGTYFIRIQTDKGFFYDKIIKE